MPNIWGGDVDGVLAEYRVVEEKVVVKLPGSMGWEEVSLYYCFLPSVALVPWMSRDR